MPFSHNRLLKSNPKFGSKMLCRAKGVYFYLEDGTELLDGMSGLWCVNAGHGQEKIINAGNVRTWNAIMIVIIFRLILIHPHYRHTLLSPTLMYQSDCST